MKESFAQQFASDIGELLGADRKTFASAVNSDIEKERMRLWQERVHDVNWELFDRGTQAFTWYAIEETINGAKNANLLPVSHEGDIARYFAESAIRTQLGQPVETGAFAPFKELREELETPLCKSMLSSGHGKPGRRE